MKDNDAKLKERNPELFHVAREHGTEPPFVGKYVHTTDTGVYVCAVCNSPLFSSDTKFDSGSGWPSFTDPMIRDAVTLREDISNNMTRTEVRCARCDAHLGHVFQDGPMKGTKTCARFCINSVSLDLKQND